MKEKPILFNTEMVTAILDDRKTQTRRVINHFGNGWHYKKLLCDWALSEQPCQFSGGETPWQYLGKGEPKEGDWLWTLQTAVNDNACFPIRCPYGQPGDELWVRETWKPVVSDAKKIKDSVLYKADGYSEWKHKWKSSIYMPRWASRIQLKIKDIRVERVQDITEKDAKAEGINLKHFNTMHSLEDEPYKSCFEWLWNSINEKRGYGWSVNPWVWGVEFERVDTSSR